MGEVAESPGPAQAGSIPAGEGTAGEGSPGEGTAVAEGTVAEEGTAAACCPYLVLRVVKWLSGGDLGVATHRRSLADGRVWLARQLGQLQQQQRQHEASSAGRTRASMCGRQEHREAAAGRKWRDTRRATPTEEAKW